MCNAPNKVLLSAGITSADMCRINHEGRLAIEKTVERQNSARTKVSEEFKERHAGIERLRKEMVDCKVPSLGGHMPFLVLDLPLQATVR